ncbi:MAG: AraC family transcriptional regulator ligand-binding domain-containing protein [Halopseudomonas sp.]
MLSQQLWLSPSIHPVYARLICAELRRRGFTAQQIIADTRLNWEGLHHNNRFLSFDQMHRLALHALELSQCPWLGIEVGTHTDVSAHGTAGYACIAAPTVGVAIATLQRYSSLRQNIAAFEIEPGPGCTMVLHEKLILPALREYLLGHFTTAMLRMLETASGLPLHDQITLHWPMPEAPWSDAYKQIAAKVIFNSPQLRIELPANYFHTPCLTADPDAERLALRDCENQLSMVKPSLAISSRRFVRRRSVSVFTNTDGIVMSVFFNNASRIAFSCFCRLTCASSSGFLSSFPGSHRSSFFISPFAS